MEEFLHQTHPQAPKEYIKQACRELSPYMPVYHFARVAGLDLDSLRDCIEREPVRRNRILDRISGKLVLPSGPINSDTPVSIKRRRILRQLEAGDMHDLYSGGPLRLYEAVTHFQPSNPPAELLGLLRRHLDECFNEFESNRRTMFRKAVAHLDEVLNRPE